MKPIPVRRAFTLMEILVTVAIIALLASIGLFIGAGVTNSARVSSTKATFQVLRDAMTSYLKENPEPSADVKDWLVKLTLDPKNGGNISKQKWFVGTGSNAIAVDAWGNQIYYLPSKNSINSTPPLVGKPPAVFAGFATFPQDMGFFYSMGKDGQPGGNDDLFSDGVSPAAN